MSISTSFSGHFWFSALKTLSETYDLFEMEFNFDEFLSQQLLSKSINTLTCNSSTKIPYCSSGLIKEALCFNYGAECEKNNYGEYFPYQTSWMKLVQAMKLYHIIYFLPFLFGLLQQFTFHS
ncbi:hypothetical protein GLOIN_2v1828214 [Rhizophagus irregularis DAOM 181602=DAOM 197198]|nr:hypothetical protein GLOIN_2v1828214 [Rhizophagus irregularis DAOM 181602=DAOM 197198]